MATAIGLGVQFTANANGMTKGLTQADRAIQNLAKQASQAARLFDGFTSSSTAAAASQQQVATDIAFLGSALKTGQISAEQYARELQAIVGSAQGAAAAFAEGARITEQVATAEERRASQLERLGQLLAQGAISEETYSRAAAAASGANEEAAQAESERAQSLARAAQITQANLAPQQKYDAEVLELTQHLNAGRISQDTFNSALAKATQSFVKAESAAKGYDKAIDAAGDGGVMKFNELSGVLAAIPGPIGNVAGRLSGLASAGEGLAKVFGNGAGLSGGLATIGTSVAGLINPFTAGLAAVAAFGAGAVAVGKGLLELEDRVEGLGNLADQLGVSFEFIQVLEESANRSGVSIETLAGSMTRLQKTLAGADEESKAAQEALGRLGVSIEELNGLSQQDQIRLIGDRIAAIKDPAARTAAAMALFGRSGAALLPFFKNLKPAAADIERLGGALSDIDRGRIDDFGAGIDALGVASSRLGELLLLPFVGLGEGIAQGAAEFLGGINRIADVIGDILEPEMDTLGNLFRAVGVAAAAAADVMAGAFRVVQFALEPLGGGILPAIGAGIALINRQILIGAIANLAKFFTAAAAAAYSYATASTTAAVSTVALGVSIRTAINSTGVGVLVTLFGLAAGAVLEWAFASDEGAGKIGGVGTTAETAAEKIKRLADELAREDANYFEGVENAVGQAQAAINEATVEAQQFGQEGFDAAVKFQESVRLLQQQARDGILNETSLAQEVEKARAVYQKQIDVIKERNEAIARAAQAQIDADRLRADSFMQSQGIGAESDATRNAEDLAAITRQIEETEAAIVEARARGDKEAEAAAIKRLQLLDQAQAAAQQRVDVGYSAQDVQQTIDEVQGELDSAFTFDNFQIAPEAFSEAQAQLAELQRQFEEGAIDPETYRQAADAIRDGFDDALATAQKIADLNERYAERAAEIESDRLAALEKAGPSTVKVSDIRTSEGASQFLQMATGQQDPAIEEYRKQLNELKKISSEINRLGGTVEIVGVA